MIKLRGSTVQRGLAGVYYAYLYMKALELWVSRAMASLQLRMALASLPSLANWAALIRYACQRSVSTHTIN